MTEQERTELIRLDRLAHAARHLKRRKAREASDQRKRNRGLAAAIERMKPSPTNDQRDRLAQWIRDNIDPNDLG